MALGRCVLPVHALSNEGKEAGNPLHNRRETGPDSLAGMDASLVGMDATWPIFKDKNWFDKSKLPSNLRMDSTMEAGNGSGCASSVLEAALEAWADCRPDGYTLPENSIPLVLPAIACRVPGSWESPGTSDMVNELFTPTPASGSSKPKPSVFERMLKAHHGRVHFLYFWSAFSKAARLLASYDNGTDRGQSMSCNDGLTLELETLRDSILRSLEAAAVSISSSPSQAKGSELFMSAAQLMEVVKTTAAMSSSPEFWHAAEGILAENRTDSSLNMEELTVVIISWLRDAIAWEHRPAPTPTVADETNSDATALDSSRSAKKASEGMPVYLHIYDVSQEESVHNLNKWLASRYSPLKFGGVFHAGVEVNGLEWSYGMSLCETMPGISCVEPMTHPAHRYRQTVRLRSTKKSAEEIADLLTQVIEEYPGDDYDLLRRNCCHFADDFCRRLGAGRIPSWVHRLARVGARVDGALQAVTGRKLLQMDDDDDINPA